MSLKRMDQSDIIRNNYLASCFLLPDFKHSHDFFELSFVIHGQSLNIINDIPYHFARGKCAIIRPRDTHYFQKKDSPKQSMQYEHKDIYVKEEKLVEICNTMHPDLYQKIVNYPTPICFDISEDAFNFIWQKSLRLSEAMQNKNPNFSILHVTIVSVILNQWIEKELFIENVRPQWLNDLLPLFNSADFLSLSVTDIAKSVGYSLPHFSSEFKKYMNIPAVQYLTLKRLAFSKQLLVENRMNIIDIAQLLGFANPSTYSKHFLKEFGITPSEYRKRKNSPPPKINNP